MVAKKNKKAERFRKKNQTAPHTQKYINNNI